MPAAHPTLPPEGEYTPAELAFIEASPPGIWPTNQDSNFGQIRAVIAAQVQQLDDQADTLFRNMFALTADTELELWEEMYGLPPNPSGLTITDRRALVSPRRHYGPFTRARRQAIVEKFILATFGDSPELTPAGLVLDSSGIALLSGSTSLTGTYNIVENVTNFSFDVRILNTITINESGFRREMDRIKPAHLSYTITYTPTP